MSRRISGAAVLLAALIAGQAFASAQTGPAQAQARRTQARRPAAPPPLQTEAATVTCPTLLGQGARTGRSFCDVLIGHDPAAGILIPLPPHVGDVTLTFELHNRHTYSEDQIRNKRGYHRYFASIGVLTADNTLISRAYVQSEFRTADDLVDRVLGGSGPGGLKAVAPTGTETIVLTIPEAEQSVSILGEKLSVVRVDGARDEFITPGRPIAVISNVMVEYRPGPPPRPARGR
jgi:hypothetical protein